jgi:hypothetical protein
MVKSLEACEYPHALGYRLGSVGLGLQLELRVGSGVCEPGRPWVCGSVSPADPRVWGLQLNPADPSQEPSAALGEAKLRSSLS